MQDFFENAQPRVVAMMLIGIVLLIALVEATYLLWPQIKSYQQLHSSHQVLKQAVSDNDSLSNQLQRIDSEVKNLSH